MQTDSSTGKQAERQTPEFAPWHLTDRQTYTYTHTHTHTHRQIDTDVGRQKRRQASRHADSSTGRQPAVPADRLMGRPTDGQTDSSKRRISPLSTSPPATWPVFSRRVTSMALPWPLCSNQSREDQRMVIGLLMTLFFYSRA